MPEGNASTPGAPPPFAAAAAGPRAASCAMLGTPKLLSAGKTAVRATARRTRDAMTCKPGTSRPRSYVEPWVSPGTVSPLSGAASSARSPFLRL